MHIRNHLLTVLILIVLAAPVSATYLVSGVTISPDGRLEPGTPAHVVATLALLPSGSETFVRGHQLELLTGLTGARWNLQVVTDGYNAARQTGSGNASFVNGELLAYPTDHDVSLVVTIDGTISPGANDSVALVGIKEIDNTGSIVPGSTIMVSRPVVAPDITAAATPTLPSQVTPPPYPSLPVPTRSAGFALPAGIAGVAAAFVLRGRSGI